MSTDMTARFNDALMRMAQWEAEAEEEAAREKQKWEDKWANDPDAVIKFAFWDNDRRDARAKELAELRAKERWDVWLWEQPRYPTCADGWVVTYSTGRVPDGFGKFSGKFVTAAFKPKGKGSLSANKRWSGPWEDAYQRGFAKRKDAKARALAILHEHDKEES